jgi:hypothetical protein
MSYYHFSPDEVPKEVFKRASAEMARRSHELEGKGARVVALKPDYVFKFQARPDLPRRKIITL